MYQGHGSLVSLSRYSTVGSLMGNLVGGKMAVEGRLARFVYVSLYRMHLRDCFRSGKGRSAGAFPSLKGQVFAPMKPHRGGKPTLSGTKNPTPAQPSHF